MRTLITLLYLLIITISANAQTIEITGSLADSVNKSKLPYGNVILKNDKDSIITSVLTNEKGEFKFKNISYKKGMYLLTNYLCYTPKKIDFPQNTKTTIDVGEIPIKQSTAQIKEATIVGKINYVEQKFDRKVFNINEEKVAAARTILDLLRTLPGVVVDDDGNVRYKGADATIYVDDQPLNFIYPKIEMIPVDKVDKIELIDAAMRTGGDGRGGIINIKFKPVNTDGLSGMLSTTINSIRFNNIDKSKEFLNINYKKKKFTFFINSSFENNNTNTNYLIENNITIFQTPSAQYSNTDNTYKRQTNYNYIGAIYKPSQNTKLYLGGGLFTLKNRSISEEIFSENNTINQDILNSYECSESLKENQIYKGITFSYWHKFDTTDTYLKVLGSFSIYDIFSKRNTIYNYNTIISNDIDSTFNYSNNRDLYTKSFYFNIFYNKILSENSRWNLFYYLSTSFGDTSANKYYISDKLFLPQSQFDNNINQKHDLSWRIGTKLKKWKLDGGVNLKDNLIRGSYTRYNINVEDTVIPLNKNYFKILPSATIAYALSDTAELKLTLSQTSELPYFYQLSDYIDKNNLYSWKTGNSSLKPVDFYSAYLSYTYTIEKWNTSAEYFFNYTNNEVAHVSIPLTSLLTLSKPENLAKQSNTGVDLSLWVQVNSKFNFSISSSIFHTYYNTKFLANTAAYYNLPAENLVKKQFGYNVKYSMEYKIKKFYAMFYVNYFAKELTFDGYDKAWINSSFNISRKFLKDQFNVSLGINNIFDDLLEHGSYSNNFGIISDSKTTGSKYKRLYSISIKYVFRQGDRGTKDYKIGG
jgi:hypothetical protein